MQFCAADDFVRNRNVTNMQRVVRWIQRSGYDLTKPLRAEVGLAQESKDFFIEENCISVGDAGEDIEVMFRVFDGGHRLGACRFLRGRLTVHLILLHTFIVALFLGESVGKINTNVNKNTHVVMDNFEGNVVPMVLHKRLRLLPTDSGLSYSNYNMTTLRGNVYFVLNLVIYCLIRVSRYWHFDGGHYEGAGEYCEPENWEWKNVG